MKIPEQLAIMVLPGATLLPHSIMPLFIFEPRYRAMLADALEAHRMFAIAQLRPDAPGEEGNDTFFRTVGAGLIRVCRGNDDGTSYLILQGAARVRITGFEAGKPYRLARIETFDTEIRSPEAVAVMRKDLNTHCHRLAIMNPGLQHIATTLDALGDDEAAADIVAAACVAEPALRQGLLEEPCLDRRLELLIAHLETLGQEDGLAEA